MKYKLINNKTKEETICDKVTIDEFDYYVGKEVENRSGKIAYISNDTYKNELRIVTTVFGNDNLKDCKKIIATNNPNIDILKLIKVQDLAFQNLKELGFNNTSYASHCMQSFIKDYKQSQETHPFSEKDMIEFKTWCNNNTEHNWSNLKYKSTEELLQLWKEQQSKIVYYE